MADPDRLPHGHLVISEQFPNLRTLLAAYLDRTVGEAGEQERLTEFVTENDADVVAAAVDELRALLSGPSVPTAEVVRLANRQLEDEQAARTWLSDVLQSMEALRHDRLP